MFFSATLIVSLAISANALVTPHAAGLYHSRQHAALVKARAPAPEPIAAPLAQPDSSASIPKKQLRKRCKPRKTSIHSAAPSASAAAPVNVGSDPSSSPAAASHSPKPADPPSSPPAPPPAPPAPSPPAPSPPAPSPPPPKSEPKPAPQPQDPASLAGDLSNSIFSGNQVGQGTFYGTGLGACGITNNDGEDIVAVSWKLFDAYPGYQGGNPNSNPICGKKVRAFYNGKSVEATITDRCTGCAPTDLDFSPSAFDALADPSIGRINLRWTWV